MLIVHPLVHLDFFLFIHATSSQCIEVTTLKVELLPFFIVIKTNDIFSESAPLIDRKSTQNPMWFLTL